MPKPKRRTAAVSEFTNEIAHDIYSCCLFDSDTDADHLRVRALKERFRTEFEAWVAAGCDGMPWFGAEAGHGTGAGYARVSRS